MAAMMLGICGLSVEELQECLDGKRLEPNPPNLDTYTTSLDSSTSPADLETLLTLLHLLFMCPVEPGAKSRGRLSLVKLGLLAWRLSEDRDPQTQFQKRVQRCITCNHPYTRSATLWSILRLNFDRASAVFNERASMPCEWTFVLVGRLPPRGLLMPLLEKYLGSIPNEVRPWRGASPPAQQPHPGRRDELSARQAVTPLDIKFPTESVREEVRLNMIEPKGSTVLCFPVCLHAVTTVGSVDSAEDELRELFQLRLLVRLLETRLVEVLRFQRGQVYSVSVADDLSSASPHLGCMRKGHLSISFECDPAEADELIQATRSELQRLQDGTAAFTDANVAAALEQERREFEELTHKNHWWAETVLDLYFSRCHVVTGEIGATLALWWRVREEVIGGFDVVAAAKALLAALPRDAPSAIITMRPKRSWAQLASGSR